MVFFLFLPLACKKNNFSLASAALTEVNLEACFARNFSMAVSPSNFALRSLHSKISEVDNSLNS
jgi:hypothetical protein